MLTAEEYIRLKPKVLFIHNLDLLEHILKADPKQTAYKGKTEPYWKAHNIFVEEIEKVAPKGQFRKIEEGFNRRSTTVEIVSDQGSLNIDRYIGGDDLCFDEPVKRLKPKLSRTIIFDFGKNEHENAGSDCADRYQKVYEQTIRCEEEGTPCRVIAGAQHSFSEGTLKLYVVIKNYTDPIFPAIWACMKTNRAAWALNNQVADFLTGTKDSGNGRSVELVIGKDIPDDEDVQIVDSVKIRRK